MLCMAIVAHWVPMRPSHLMGPRNGVPHLCGSGWGVSGVSEFGGRGRVRGINLFVCGGGGFGSFLARPGLFQVPLGLLGGGEEEVPGHIAEDGAAWVFHPNGTMLPPVDTTDGALVYPGGVGDVADRHNERIAGTVVLLLGRSTVWGRRSSSGLGGWAVAILGGLVGLGVAAAFVGCAGGGGGFGLFATGDPRVDALRAGLEGEPFFLMFFLGGLGGFGLRLGWGGFGMVVVDAPPSPPPSPSSLTPPPRMLPHNPSSPPPPPAYPTFCIQAHSPGRK